MELNLAAQISVKSNSHLTVHSRASRAGSVALECDLVSTTTSFRTPTSPSHDLVTHNLQLRSVAEVY